MGCIGTKPKPKAPFVQTVVILRHSERRDQVDPTYKDCEEGRAWPFDPPLTEKGVKLAQDVALELAEVHAQAQFTTIITSPFYRCMQTAAELVKVLKLPVILDQEVGEVWDEAMGPERPPHRSPIELEAMAKELGMTVKNPRLPESGIKLFGKLGKFPETTRDGHHRCSVRVEQYIQESAATRQNFIIVSHVPAVAAMMDIFQHGMCHLEKMQYCARVVAKRSSTARLSSALDNSKLPDRQQESVRSVFAEQWEVDSKGISFGLNYDATEEAHLKTCVEIEKRVQQRRDRRTSTDTLLQDMLKEINLAPEGNRC